MRKFLFVIGGLLLLNVIILLFLINFHIGIVLQALVSVSILIYAFFLEKFNRIIHIIAIIICIIPLIFITFLAIYGNINNSTYDEDVVIVLGTGIDGQTVRGNLARRLDEAVLYYDKNPEAIIAVCGGQGPQEEITEAMAMERYLVDKGIPKESIIKEDKSTSTYENFSFAKLILDEHFSQNFSSVLITNDYHVYRAVQTADHAGISANYIGTYTDWYTLPANYLREMLAVVKLWLIPPQ